MSININQCKHINSMSFKEKQSKLVQINANPRKNNANKYISLQVIAYQCKFYEFILI